MKVLLVGEANPYSLDPHDALLPEPRGAAGDRLRRLLEMTDEEYLATFARINLCRRTWDRARAREKAARILAEWPDPVVLLGRKVAAAFELAFEPFSRHGRLLVLPHPSGLNRMWDAPGVRARGRDAVYALLDTRGRIAQDSRGGQVA